MAVPADGITLDDKRATTERLLRAGADIHALNTVRKHLSAIKGGWLAARAGGAVPTRSPSPMSSATIRASSRPGRRSPTPAAFEDALDVLRPLRRRGGVSARPSSTRLQRGAAGAVPETPKPGDPRLARSTHDGHRIAARRDGRRGWRRPRALGYHVAAPRRCRSSAKRGRRRSRTCARCWRAPRGSARPACIVSSGETTVHVTGRGKGRPQSGIRARRRRPAARRPAAPAVARQRRHRRHRRPDRRGRRDRRFDHARARRAPPA